MVAESRDAPERDAPDVDGREVVAAGRRLNSIAGRKLDVGRDPLAPALQVQCVRVDVYGRREDYLEVLGIAGLKESNLPTLSFRYRFSDFGG